jgi:membrane associated rhomboid family serine protease
MLLWIVTLANAWFGYKLNYLGIYPREVASLTGILAWPFLHLNFYHLTLNTTPLLVLGYFVALRGIVVYLKATLLILIIGGLGVWIFGRPAVHIGASGLVFGFFGFLVAVGIYERSISSLAIASFTVFYYGGMLYGVIPVDSFISWEAHFFGLLAGIWAARVLAFKREES